MFIAAAIFSQIILQNCESGWAKNPKALETIQKLSMVFIGDDCGLSLCMDIGGYSDQSYLQELCGSISLEKVVDLAKSCTDTQACTLGSLLILHSQDQHSTHTESIGYEKIIYLLLNY
jgi:hypothetical protein